MNKDTEHIVGEHIVDCKINNWEQVTFIEGKTDERYKVVRGNILWDRNRPFEPGFWVCSTLVVRECWDEKILYTENTCYQLFGEGQFHESYDARLYDLMMQGLDFQQANWTLDKNDSNSIH